MTPPAFPEAAAVAPAFGHGLSAAPSRTLTAAPPVVSCWSDVSRLVRPRIAVMVLATVLSAVWLTAGGVVDGPLCLVLLVGTALVAASSSIANQILERDSDRLMSRTATRPLAAGRLTVRGGWWLAGATLLVGAVLVWIGGGRWATTAALATWLLYIAAYTPLKRVTPLNTAVGAVAGALPVAIGWAAAGGPEHLAGGDARTALAAAALGTLLYLWQFPHFMAIAWLYRKQYAAAGLRMLTVEDPSGLRAGGQSLAASLAMIPVSLVLAVPSGSIRLFVSAAVASLVYAVAAGVFAVRRDDDSARTLLFTSLGSLLAVLAAAVLFGSPT